MDIETIDLTKLNKKPFINIELAEVGDGYHATNVIWKIKSAHPDSVISAAINIFSHYINNAPEKIQIQMEEYLMKGFNNGMKDRFENIRTIKLDTSS